mmetsp:Transcript_10464/g.20958  ORF Transcript_10464/g.20958 Transcript_10464/m.20958 type:complete len:219 (-) Transcript_10464:2595-3251(-)
MSRSAPSPTSNSTTPTATECSLSPAPSPGSRTSSSLPRAASACRSMQALWAIARSVGCAEASSRLCRTPRSAPSSTTATSSTPAAASTADPRHTKRAMSPLPGCCSRSKKTSTACRKSSSAASHTSSSLPSMRSFSLSGTPSLCPRNRCFDPSCTCFAMRCRGRRRRQKRRSRMWSSSLASSFFSTLPPTSPECVSCSTGTSSPLQRRGTGRRGRTCS